MENNKKFRCDVAGIRESKWSNNGLLFDAEYDAQQYLRDLSQRWFGYDMARIVDADVPRNETIDMGDPTIFQNFRK